MIYYDFKVSAALRPLAFPEQMSNLFAIIAIPVLQAIGVSFLGAWILQLRAQKLRSWTISYKDAFLVSVKAVLLALAFATLVVFLVAFVGNSDENLLRAIGQLCWLIAWWFAHSNGLLKLAAPSSLLSPKDARALSASVFAYLAVGGLVVTLVLILFAGLMFAIQKV